MNSAESLTLVASIGHRIIFSAETPRRGEEFSITIDGQDNAWGEFISVEDLALLHVWTGRALYHYFDKQEEAN